jgi:folate-binding protein YgfZ
MSVEIPDTTGTERAWRALQSDAVLADRSDRLRMLFSGDKAAETLNGLLTSDVLALTPGTGQYSAALTPKGKVIADLRIFASPEGLLVDVTHAAAPGFVAMVRKFVNPRLAKYQDVSEQSGDIGVFGHRARHIVRSVLADVEIPVGLPPYAQVRTTFSDSAIMIARVPDFGVEGYEIMLPRGAMESLQSKLVSAGAIVDAAEALLVARIEAGRPEFGIDMDDTMLAQEVDMERLDAISFSKGCYTGQETVARVHFRGHVNRRLRGLRFTDAVVPPAGVSLTDDNGKEVGTVKSGALSPRLGAIALAVVRREIEPGATVRATWPEGQVEARVEALPFPS